MHREFSMTPSGYRKNVIYCRIYIWEGVIRMIHRVNALRPPLKGQTHLRIISSCLRRFFEVIVLSAFLILWLSMVVFLKKPVVLPTVNEAGSFSVQYIFPLLVSLFIQTILWLLLTLFKKSAPELNAKKIMLSLFYIPFIFVTLFLHFNFKSWMPLIHPVTYDSLYYRIDHITPVASAVSLLGKMIDFNQSGAFLYFFLIWRSWKQGKSPADILARPRQPCPVSISPTACSFCSRQSARCPDWRLPICPYSFLLSLSLPHPNGIT